MITEHAGNYSKYLEERELSRFIFAHYVSYTNWLGTHVTVVTG